ncbi:Phenazine biosynthesis protein PhzF [Bosea sp. 62]|uniref:PhzF family phenazine biosynthesis protein n=1 Tax=unclassified Bosea (in: a-proteobacteria) TaxID=2653178 RepID=UPI00125B3296|nr:MULTISPECIES: PhzF family phenazine biosynthesis protein [unclassified Bosea (in: a-proteobacteria)]CAD5258309.1 Phenazine biosynthesis protein PhzF [Bosea sp. 46]CAD5262752.1 Phenazine biosynthesis protein PhzF [Bosea sp. 21B]CAD5277667.1 Phenazine biosynthesis protein PhzF [Bosea sp. 7B]VVT58807.1 Phenazine biosynthesis protein PhzF [Bosea sp. EC-HK365B]VXB60880.1 Phenazine biosynthesis protein PhzF [Bosea sp. 29B]
MPSYPFETVDVFTDRRFGGNQLAVFTDARGLSDAEMQALAAEMNYSETTFVLPPSDPANTARVRIFHRTAEMPFAGHPNVGTACVLAGHGRDRDGVLLFEEIAGLVEVRIARDAAGLVTGGTIAAPQALSLDIQLPPDAIAACAGLSPQDVLTGRHPPQQASVGVKFVLVEVTPEALTRATPDIAAYRRLEQANPALEGRLSIFFYAWDGDRVRARMFAPLAGTWEDPATGSASATLAALTLSLSDKDSVAFDITQGVEMGRPSLLHAAARRVDGEIRATVGGGCVPVLRGDATV